MWPDPCVTRRDEPVSYLLIERYQLRLWRGGAGKLPADPRLLVLIATKEQKEESLHLNHLILCSIEA
jgi:hypothetical protein